RGAVREGGARLSMRTIWRRARRSEPYQIRKRHGRANAEAKAPEDRRLYRRSETDEAWFECGGFGLRCWMLDVRRWMFARHTPGALVPNEGLVSAAPVLSSARLHDGY